MTQRARPLRRSLETAQLGCLALGELGLNAGHLRLGRNPRSLRGCSCADLSSRGDAGALRGGGSADRLLRCGVAGGSENRCARHGDRDRALEAVSLDVRVVEQTRDAVAVERERDIVAARKSEDLVEVGRRQIYGQACRLLVLTPDLEPELGLLVLGERCLEHAAGDDRRQHVIVGPAVGEGGRCRELLHGCSFGRCLQDAAAMPHLPSGASRESARRRR